jgi:hypothetical protein
MIERRNLFGLAALAPIAVLSPRQAAAQFMAANNPDASLTAQRAGSNACLPDWNAIETRTMPKAEILYRAPHGQPNGLALTSNPGEMWVIDQGGEHWISLIQIADGRVIREFKADVVGPSGLVVDKDGVMWVTSTHNTIIVACDSQTGKTLAKYTTPGSGRVYQKKGDPPLRASKLPHAYPPSSRAVGGSAQGGGLAKELGFGHLPLMAEDDMKGRTGGHGMLDMGGDILMYVAPPSRAIFTIDKKKWEVQSVFPTPGNRPHGLTWADAGKKSFWNVDSNLNAFYRFDTHTGMILEKAQLQDDPYTVCHGTKLVLSGPGAGYMYFCDDRGWLCRVRWA